MKTKKRYRLEPVCSKFWNVKVSMVLIRFRVITRILLPSYLSKEGTTLCSDFLNQSRPGSQFAHFCSGINKDLQGAAWGMIIMSQPVGSW